jgi:hypothetical protein
VARRPQLTKVTDYTTRFRCGNGIATLREEVWVDSSGTVAQYNLALIASHLSGVDNGRILGYDNAHGTHERHFMGRVQSVDFAGYATTAKRFFREAEAWRKKQ